VATAVLGREGRVVFTIDGTGQDTDMAFVTRDDDAARNHLVPWPVIAVDQLSVLVPLESPVHTIRDLAGETICFLISAPEQNALETAVHDLGIDVTRFAFQEDVEMRDAYAVGRCGAMAGPWTELSELRGPLGINRLTSRLLPNALAHEALIAVTGGTDREWATIVLWVAHAVVPNLPGDWPVREIAIPPAGIRDDWRQNAGAYNNRAN
jgi:general L-amino acid transport system substrate-binding protein